MAHKPIESEARDPHVPVTSSISSGENTVWADVTSLLQAASQGLQEGELIHGDNFNLFAAMSALETFAWICSILGVDSGEFDASASVCISLPISAGISNTALPFRKWSFPLCAAINASHDSKDFSLGTSNLIQMKQITQPETEFLSPEMATTRWPFFIFLGGSMFCLLSSSVCHLFSCHSRSLNILLLRMDYVGIAVMIITSFSPPIYYIFQCDPHWQFIYLAGITAMGMFTIITLLSHPFQVPNIELFKPHSSQPWGYLAFCLQSMLSL
ncbi:hypothetical protein AAG906_011500 [Vitis piasezkii]